MWDPFGVWRELTRVGEQWATLKTPAGSPASSPLQWLLDIGRSRLLGRRISWRVGGQQLEFDVDDISLGADSLSLGAGQADQVIVTASELTWGSQAFDSARATFRNIHTRPGKNPALVSAPIDLHLAMKPTHVAERVAARVPWLVIEFTEAGELRARHRKRFRWLWVAFTVRPAGVGVTADARELVVGRRRVRIPSRLGRIDIPLSLAADARVTDVVALPSSVELRVRFDERRVDFKDAMSFLARRDAPDSEG